MDASCRSVQTPPFTHLSLGAETLERPVRFRETRLGKQAGRSHAPFFLRSIRGWQATVGLTASEKSGRRVSRTAGSLYPRQRGCIGGQSRKKVEFAIIHRVADDHPELRPLRAASGTIGLGRLGAHPLLMSYFPANEPVRHAARPVAIAPQSSVTNRSEANGYFFRSLRISFRAAACCAWVGQARRGSRPRPRRRRRSRMPLGILTKPT